MTEEEIRKIINDTFSENIMNNLDSSIISKYIEGLEKENQELKKQLHKSGLEIQHLIEQNIDCPSNCNKLRRLKEQQKDFIEWLENLIGQNETIIEVSKYGLPKECSKLLIDFYKSILSKYKEVVGGIDESV